MTKTKTKRRTSKKKESFSKFVYKTERNALIGRISMMALLKYLGYKRLPEYALSQLRESALFYTIWYIVSKYIDDFYARKIVINGAIVLSIMNLSLMVLGMRLNKDDLEFYRSYINQHNL